MLVLGAIRYDIGSKRIRRSVIDTLHFPFSFKIKKKRKKKKKEIVIIYKHIVKQAFEKCMHIIVGKL